MNRDRSMEIYNTLLMMATCIVGYALDTPVATTLAGGFGLLMYDGWRQMRRTPKHPAY